MDLALNMPKNTNASNNINAVLKIAVGESFAGLDCAVYEINENQGYGIPQMPIDDGTFLGDTIFKNPLKVSVRVLVNGANITNFKKSIDELNRKNQFFTIYGLHNNIYKNMKIEAYSVDLTSANVSSQFFNIQFTEIKLVKALVSAYKSVSRGAYSANADLGNKPMQERKKSVLRGLF